MPDDERTKREIHEDRIRNTRLEENEQRKNGSGGKKGKSRFRKILLIYVCAGILYSCICGMCMASVWRTDDHHTGACFSRIIGLKVIPNYEKSEFTLTADVEYRTLLPIFPAVPSRSYRENTWYEWFISRTGQQSELFSFSVFKNPAYRYPVIISENCKRLAQVNIDGRWVEKSICCPTPRAVKLENGLWAVDTMPSHSGVVHPADVPLLKASPFFLLRQKNLFDFGCVFQDRLGSISCYDLMRDRLHRECQKRRLSNGWITVWKVIITPINILADVITMPLQICFLICIILFVPSGIC